VTDGVAIAVICSSLALVFVACLSARRIKGAIARSVHAANQQLQQIARDSAHTEADHRAQLEAIRKDMDTLADDLAACRTPEAVCARIQRLRDHTETRSRDHGEGQE
jgi:hypothetical protein